VQTALNFQSYTLGNDVMMLMGTDFSYENAATWYINLDKLIHYVNLDGRVNAFYSTPSIYASAKIEGVKLPVRYDDMMPYADDAHAVWAGYFTSRPALKGYVRDTSAYQVAARQLQLFAGGVTKTQLLGPDNPLYVLEAAMGVAQHHDGVSGTSTQHVADDYAMRIARGRLAADVMVGSAIANLTGDVTNSYVRCDLTNVTICPALTTLQPTSLVIYNALSHDKSRAPVRVPISLSSSGSVAVSDPSGNPVVAQLLPLNAADIALRTYYNYSSTAPTSQWLVFQASLPAMGFATYFITPTSSSAAAPLTHLSQPTPFEGDFSFGNGIVSLTVDGEAGTIKSFSKQGISVPLAQRFAYYNSSVGGPDDGTGDWSQSSGAYIFRPNSSMLFPVGAGTAAATLYSGPVVSELYQDFSYWVSQRVRVWAGEETVDFEWTVGPVPADDGLGKEVITRYDTGINSNTVSYTDSNGRDAMRRVRNARPNLPNYDVKEPVADNYYPINVFQYLKSADDVGPTLSIITDRSQAGASLVDGSLEFMVHRRLQADDNRGVVEPINEPGLDGNGLRVRGIHRLSIDLPANAGATRRLSAADLLFPPQMMIAPTNFLTPQQWLAKFTPIYSGLSTPLSPRVQVLTAHSQSPDTLLLRLAHMFEAGEDANLSLPVTVSLSSLFAHWEITSAKEMTLTANQELASAPITTYNTDDGQVITLPVVPPKPTGASLSVNLSPMQIRTFLCVVRPK